MSPDFHSASPGSAGTSDRRVAPSRLPAGAERLFGRDDELLRLEAAWNDPRIHVVTLVAWGGVGKTALVADWIGRLAARDYDGADYFDWSFYSQGTRDTATASGDPFVDAALRFFGDETTADSAKSPWDKGARLARLVAERRTLLVLDGLEPLQHPPGPLAGELKDAAIAALLKGLAGRNAGLCLVTTRESIKDLASYRGSTAKEWKLEHLSTPAGVELLAHHGVHGPPGDLKGLVEDVHGHALTLNLFGRYLARAHDGDVRRRDRVKLVKADRDGHASHVMEAYEKWLVMGGEDGWRQLAILRLLGLFDRPIDAGCLAALRRKPIIAGLTDPLIDLDEEAWNVAVRDLIDGCLLAAPAASPATARVVEGGGALDAHPLVREHFGRQLREKNPDAWKAAHSRLFDHLKDTTEHWPNTLAGLQPLYQALVHGCQAGREQEACVDVYRDRVLRGAEFYSTSRLGAFGADLGAVNCFFERPWSRVLPSLPRLARAWVLREAAYRLRALGRLTEAIEPIQLSLQIYVEAGHANHAARSASILSELELTLGKLATALRAATQAVEFAGWSGAKRLHPHRRATLADILHQLGDRDKALALFREAEAITAEQRPQSPWLFSRRGFLYCDLLLAGAERAAAGGRLAGAAPAECGAAEVRAERSLAWTLGHRQPLPLLTVALDRLTLGRARLYRALLEGSALADASAEIEQAVDGFRRGGRRDYLPRALLTRAWLRSAVGSVSGAHADLDEAQEIAERGPMPLHLADVHLYRARLFHDRAALAEARRLIDKHGYGRRREELEDAEEASRSWPDPPPSRSPDMSQPEKRFRVALSFTGEHRPFVEGVAAHLASSVGKQRVLYDAYYEAEFARVDLDTYLQRLYHNESDLIAIFLSTDYERKEWCGLEWRAIRDLIKGRKGDSVMPLRFDATEIPGLFSGDGYVSIRDRAPEVIADLILQRLGLPTPATLPASPRSAAPPAPPPSRPKSAALAVWEEKLAYLEGQEAITVDPDGKFRLRKLIDEAREKVREHGGGA